MQQVCIAGHIHAAGSAVAVAVGSVGNASAALGTLPRWSAYALKSSKVWKRPRTSFNSGRTSNGRVSLRYLRKAQNFSKPYTLPEKFYHRTTINILIPFYTHVRSDNTFFELLKGQVLEIIEHIRAELFLQAVAKVPEQALETISV